MKYLTIILTLTFAAPAYAGSFEPELYNNCNGQSWSTVWKCVELGSGIRKQLQKAREAEAKARQSTDELERKAYEAEAAARKAGAEHLLNQWNKQFAK